MGILIGCISSLGSLCRLVLSGRFGLGGDRHQKLNLQNGEATSGLQLSAWLAFRPFYFFSWRFGRGSEADSHSTIQCFFAGME
jgi:hypothetical protein